MFGAVALGGERYGGGEDGKDHDFGMPLPSEPTAAMSFRLLNTVVWVWLGVSNALMPVASQGSEFWFSKLTQLFQINEYLPSEPALFIRHLIIPLVLWFLIDRWLSGFFSNSKL
jgi:hypothetical protein